MSILDIETSKEYIKYIKTLNCLACGSFPVDADHLKAIGMGGNRKRSNVRDFTCIPLCRSCHTERHQLGNYQFEHKHSVNLWRDAFNYFVKYLTQRGLNE